MEITKGRNLIFLISQPRSGSTMMQRILGKNPAIHTTSEPWLMLHPLYALKLTGIETEYSSDLAARGANDLISHLPGGLTEYYDRLREMYSQMYQRIIEASGKSRYLDKTPRYYFIIKELYGLFPEAKFIILFRNPLSVLSSITSTWTKRDWYRLSEFKYDLIAAPDYLLEGIEQLKTSCKSLHYERFLTDPENSLKDICGYLNIEYFPENINYGSERNEQWQFGDKGTVYEKNQPDSSHADKWKNSLDDPQAWRVMNDYLEFIGKARLEKMGYEYDVTRKILDEKKPPMDIDRHSISLFVLLDNTRFALIENKRLNQQLKQKSILIAEVYNSFSYRIGNFLLKPISFFQQLFKNVTNKKQ